MYRTTKKITVQIETTKLVPEFVYWEGEKYQLRFSLNVTLSAIRLVLAMESGSGARWAVVMLAWCMIDWKRHGHLR